MYLVWSQRRPHRRKKGAGRGPAMKRVSCAQQSEGGQLSVSTEQVPSHLAWENEPVLDLPARSYAQWLDPHPIPNRSSWAFQ
jgi:hypothetical protein